MSKSFEILKNSMDSIITTARTSYELQSPLKPHSRNPNLMVSKDCSRNSMTKNGWKNNKFMRRKSCYCSNCGDMSRLERTFQDLPSYIKIHHLINETECSNSYQNDDYSNGMSKPKSNYTYTCSSNNKSPLLRNKDLTRKKESNMSKSTYTLGNGLAPLMSLVKLKNDPKLFYKTKKAQTYIKNSKKSGEFEMKNSSEKAIDKLKFEKLNSNLSESSSHLVQNRLLRFPTHSIHLERFEAIKEQKEDITPHIPDIQPKSSNNQPKIQGINDGLHTPEILLNQSKISHTPLTSPAKSKGKGENFENASILSKVCIYDDNQLGCEMLNIEGDSSKIIGDDINNRAITPVSSFDSYFGCNPFESRGGISQQNQKKNNIQNGENNNNNNNNNSPKLQNLKINDQDHKEINDKNGFFLTVGFEQNDQEIRNEAQQSIKNDCFDKSDSSNQCIKEKMESKPNILQLEENQMGIFLRKTITPDLGEIEKSKLLFRRGKSHSLIGFNPPKPKNSISCATDLLKKKKFDFAYSQFFAPQSTSKKSNNKINTSKRLMVKPLRLDSIHGLDTRSPSTEAIFFQRDCKSCINIPMTPVNEKLHRAKKMKKKREKMELIKVNREKIDLTPQKIVEAYLPHKSSEAAEIFIKNFTNKINRKTNSASPNNPNDIWYFQPKAPLAATTNILAKSISSLNTRAKHLKKFSSSMSHSGTPTFQNEPMKGLNSTLPIFEPEHKQSLELKTLEKPIRQMKLSLDEHIMGINNSQSYSTRSTSTKKILPQKPNFFICHRVAHSNYKINSKYM